MSDNETSRGEFFVSRRGRHVGVNQIDFKDINVEDEAPTTEISQKQEKKTEVKPEKSRPPKRVSSGWSKKKTIVVLIVLLVLAAPVIIGEVVAAQYRSGSGSARAKLDKLVQTTVLPAQKKTTVSADQLRSVATQVNDIATQMCRGGLLDNMAGLYPRAKSQLDSCKQSQVYYAALVTSLYDLEAQARYLEQIGDVVKPVATPITDDYAVISAQQESWKKASESLKKLSPPSSMKSAHDELSGHITAVSEAWSKLNTANNEQNAAGFTEAEKTLNTEYEAVRNSVAAISESLSKTQQQVSVAYVGIK